MKSSFHSLSSFLRMWQPYVKLFSLLPNLYITDKVSQLPGYGILASSLMGKWLCFKGLSTHTFVSFKLLLMSSVWIYWCPRVTCTFKWEHLLIIHIMSSINTGRDTRKFISSPSYLPHMYLNAECNHQASLLPFSPFMLFWFHVSLVNSTGCVPTK